MNKLKYTTALSILLCLYGGESAAFGSNIADKIYNAAATGDFQTIEYYLRQGYSIDAASGDGVTALCRANWANNGYAYDVLISYGASSYSPCMYMAAPKPFLSTTTYVVAGGLAVGGATVAIAAGGGGGGGSSGKKKENNNNNNGNNNNNNNSNGEPINIRPEDLFFDNEISEVVPIDNVAAIEIDNSLQVGSDGVILSNNSGVGSGYINIGSGTSSGWNISIYHSLSPSTFRNNGEYTSTYFLASGGVNFLDAINAATAYGNFYGTDGSGKVVNKLRRTVSVGIIDTGVWTGHPEFQTASGSKIKGYNYDYGPCRNGDRTNCWNITYTPSAIGSSYVEKAEFYDEHGNIRSTRKNSGVALNAGPWAQWAATYPSDYDWDNLQNDPNPIMNYDLNPMLGGYHMHGTHIAGLIAANWDRSRKGMNGVSFSNTTIDAVRWDRMASLKEPIIKLARDGVVAINFSIGPTANSSVNASKIASYRSSLPTGMEEGLTEMIKNYYSKVTVAGRTTVDGAVLVKAAGNDGYKEPDLISGLKLLGKFANLQMLVVISADVTLNSNGTVRSYKKTPSSNSCGSTASYCIAAPGGNSRGGKYIFSTGRNANENDEKYLGMAGTSQAAPIVAGSIAFLKAAFPSLTSEQIIALLRDTANTNGDGYNATKHDDAVYGAGLIDLGAAVTYQSPYPGLSSAVATLSGDTIDGSYVRLDNALLNVTGGMGEALIKVLPESIAAFDRYDRAYSMPLRNYINVAHGGYKNFKNDVYNITPNQRRQEYKDGDFRFSYAQGSLNYEGSGFMMMEYRGTNSASGFYFSENTRYKSADDRPAELNNPFMSFNSAYGLQHSRKIGTSSAIKFEVVAGENGLYDGDRDYRDSSFRKEAYALNAELTLHKGPKTSFGISSGLLYENQAVLGVNGENALAIDKGQTYYIGANASWFVTPKFTLSGSYYQGYTRSPDLNSDLLAISDLVSNSFAFDANYRLNKSIDFGMRLSSPLALQRGKVHVNMAAGRDNFSNRVYRNVYTASLKPQKREYKLAWYLNKEVSDNLSFSTELDVRVHPENTNNSNDYRALFGLSWTF